MPGLNLTRDEAAQRAQTVTVEHYAVELDLTRGDTDFGSRTTITFTAQPGSSTFVDLVSNYINSIELNGTPIPTSAHDDNRIALDNLDEHNTLTVNANCQYMHTGEGLHRFVDPADDKAYTYSQFEVPDARRVFATFEQPDLKATFDFTVITPEGWTVFSNAITPEPERIDAGLKFVFPTTDKISTYITAIIAGPYEGVTDELTSADGRTIPLGVYCRASLRDSLDADRILQITKQGFEFFEGQYGVPYPFTKYDQIFVPEYNAGAMENAGCITFRDQYIFRSRPTEAQLEQRANTILHELAHMWFGDLVTMKWWDDLWLNESFAEFMSHLALAEATEYEDGWTGFLMRKDWGLSQDQLPTTHPIRAEINDLHDVEVNFDGITYAKGASVLRQMVSYVGRDNFFKGVHEYLEANKWSNATLADLLGELASASGRDMDAWAKVWLEEAGVTLLKPAIETDDEGRLTRLDVVQQPFTEGSSLRPQRLVVSGYTLARSDSEGGADQQDDKPRIERVFREELDVDGDSTPVPNVAGLPRPDVVLVNDEDLAYAKVRLDPESLKFAEEHIADFEESLPRNIILASAWDMTRDGEYPASSFIKLALAAVPVEKNMMMLNLLLRHIETASRMYAAPAKRQEQLEHIGAELRLYAQTAPAESDAQRILVRAATRNAIAGDDLQAARNLYDGKETLFGLDMDVDLKWDILVPLVRGGYASADEANALAAEDDTMTGHQNQAAALAARHDEAVKKDTYEKIMRDESIPNDTRWSMVSGFWAQARTAPTLYAPFVDDYFRSIEQVWNDFTFHIAEDIITLMFPLDLAGYLEGVDIAVKGHAWLDSHPDVAPALRRIVTECTADAERMTKAQAADA